MSFKLVPYLTAGDPDVTTSFELIKAAIGGGADAIELGVPFSDPIADGPVIQASHQRALQAGFRSSQLFDLVRQTRKYNSKIDLIVMVASTLVYFMGLDRFFEEAKQSGVTSVLIPDCSVESLAIFKASARRHGMPLILMASPTTDLKRLKKIVKEAKSFIYVISSRGTTGVRQQFSDEVSNLVKQIKKIRDIPCYVGFGVSQPAHCMHLAQFADGAIIGSHLIKKIEMHMDDPKKMGAVLKAELKRFRV